MADEATNTAEATADQTSADSAEATETSTEATTTDEGSAALGDAGKKALDAMKAKWKDADKLAKDHAAALAALQAKLDGKESEHQQSLEAQRAKDEAIAAANQRILSAEVRAAAAGKLNDPADALAYIDLTSFEVGEDGAVDSEAIGSAIADLISKKPYLAAQGGRFQGGVDGGARNDATKPTQLTRSDMARMTPEQKAAAYDAGQFDHLLGRS